MITIHYQLDSYSDQRACYARSPHASVTLADVTCESCKATPVYKVAASIAAGRTPSDADREFGAVTRTGTPERVAEIIRQLNAYDADHSGENPGNIWQDVIAGLPELKPSPLTADSEGEFRITGGTVIRFDADRYEWRRS